MKFVALVCSVVLAAAVSPPAMEQQLLRLNAAMDFLEQSESGNLRMERSATPVYSEAQWNWKKHVTDKDLKHMAINPYAKKGVDHAWTGSFKCQVQVDQCHDVVYPSNETDPEGYCNQYVVERYAANEMTVHMYHGSGRGAQHFSDQHVSFMCRKTVSGKGNRCSKYKMPLLKSGTQMCFVQYDRYQGTGAEKKLWRLSSYNVAYPDEQTFDWARYRHHMFFKAFPHKYPRSLALDEAGRPTWDSRLWANYKNRSQSYVDNANERAEMLKEQDAWLEAQDATFDLPLQSELETIDTLIGEMDKQQLF